MARVWWMTGLLVACAAPRGPLEPSARHDPAGVLVDAGHDLFLRRWTPDDPQAGGDGLGPMYNADACVTCHNQGGVGGAGSRKRNTDLLVGEHGLEVLHQQALVKDWTLDRADRIVLESMQSVAPFGRNPRGETAERNPPALFGLGAIAAVPDAWFEGTGVRRDGEGRPLRFGWKADAATLEDFVAQALAVELGLGSTERPQASVAGVMDIDAEPDVDEDAIAALAAYVASLPPPEPAPVHEDGRRAFHRAGCARCHLPDVPGASGIYSDLKLHRMGEDLSDPRSQGGSGYGLRPPPDRPELIADGRTPVRPDEWRTPPLWGVSASGPWLHDGRASTLEQAIALHGGEARTAARAFADAPLESRGALLEFLRSL